jgi:hypothetical protein
MARRSFTGGMVVLAVLGLLVAVAPADELYRQNPINSFGGLSSQDARNPGGLGWFSEVADNFTGTDQWNIAEVDFWGGYATLVGQEGNTHGFTIRFYTDNAGHPGTRIYEQDVMTFTEILYYQYPNPKYAGYAYTVVLPSPYTLPASGVYWVSVVAILDRGGGADEPQWGWIAAQAVNPPGAHQWFFSPGNFTEQGNDVSFVLIGSIGSTLVPGDLNCDGLVNAFDIDPFILALTDPVAYAAAYPNCNILNADCNGDSAVNAFDIDPFIALLTGP